MPKRNELLKFTTSFLGTSRASAQTTIVDTSYPMTYNTRWSTNANGSGTITEINEGNDAYFIVSSDNVPDGTVLSVMLSSEPSANGITGDDIVNYQYKQNVTIYNNFASLKVSIAADQVTENREEFYGMLLDSNGSNLSHAWLAINDTSKTPEPTYSMGWYSNVSATTAITSINEGSTAWLIINTTNVTNGTKMVVRINGEISESDFVDNGWERSVIIQNNIGRISYPIKADNLTEGVEKINAFLFLANDDFTVKANASLNINDTSLDIIKYIPPQVGSPINIPYVGPVALAGATGNNVLFNTHMLRRVDDGGLLYTIRSDGLWKNSFTNIGGTVYSWDPAKLTTLESRASFGRYMGSIRVNAPYGDWVDRDNYTFVTLDQLQDNISKTAYGELTALNEPDAILMAFGEGYNYGSSGPSASLSRNGWKYFNPGVKSIHQVKPSSGSSGGYVSFLLLRAFNDADINGVDAPYPRIIRAGKIGNIQTPQVITRNKSTQDFTDTNKFTLVLTNKSVLWYPMSVVRSVDRFTVYRTNTNSLGGTEFSYCIFQNYA